MGGEAQTVRARVLENGEEKRKRKRRGGRKRRKVRETAAESIERHCRGLGTLVIFEQ